MVVSSCCRCWWWWWYEECLLQAKMPVVGRGNVESSPGRQRVAVAVHQRQIETSASSSRIHHSPFTLQCFSPRRSSSLQVTCMPRLFRVTVFKLCTPNSVTVFHVWALFIHVESTTDFTHWKQKISAAVSVWIHCNYIHKVVVWRTHSSTDIVITVTETLTNSFSFTETGKKTLKLAFFHLWNGKMSISFLCRN